jgi:hypothetical protein
VQPLTGTIAILGSFLVFFLRPARALAVYIVVLLWYPSFLVVSLGAIDLPAARIVVMSLLVRCLMSNHIRGQFTWMKLDTWVTMAVGVFVGMYIIAVPDMQTVVNRGGFIIDTYFAYFVVRFVITDRNTLLTVLKTVALALVPIALLGVIESVSGWSPFKGLGQYCPWFGEGVEKDEIRWGFKRAVGPFSHAILFGCSFVLFLPLVYFLRHQKGSWHRWAYFLSAITIIGALSSMSSGPWNMLAVAVFCLLLEKRKRWSWPILGGFAFLCVIIAIASNRPFYYVIVSYIDILGGAGYHRALLIDCAIKTFSEWYLCGYCNQDPGWGPNLGGMSITDVTNEYILNGVRYGILGILVLWVLIAVAFSSLFKAYKKFKSVEMKSLCWSLGSILFSVTVVWMSVSFFGQLIPLYYCFLGMIGATYSVAQSGAAEAGVTRIVRRYPVVPGYRQELFMGSNI